jgi:hypothetical protein
MKRKRIGGIPTRALAAMKYGKMYEERALAEVAGALSEEVMPCKRSTSNGVRGAPDGVLASDRSLVEVKCPYNLLYVRGDLRRHYSSKREGLIRVDPTTREASLNARNNKQAADYYHQCQCYLRQHPSSPRVVFAVWAPRARPSKVITFDILPDSEWDFAHKRHGRQKASERKSRRSRKEEEKE